MSALPGKLLSCFQPSFPCVKNPQGIVELSGKKMYKSIQHRPRDICLNKWKLLINKNCESGKGCVFDDGGGVYGFTSWDDKGTEAENTCENTMPAGRYLNCYLLDNPTRTAHFTSQFTCLLIHLIAEERQRKYIIQTIWSYYV